MRFEAFYSLLVANYNYIFALHGMLQRVYSSTPQALQAREAVHAHEAVVAEVQARQRSACAQPWHEHLGMTILAMCFVIHVAAGTAHSGLKAR